MSRRIFSEYGFSAAGHVLPYENFIPFTDRGDGQPSGLLISDVNRAEIIRRAEALLGKQYPPLLASDYMMFRRDGNRSVYEDKYFPRRNDLMILTAAEYVEGQGRFLDAVIDLTWMIMEESSWVLPAHNLVASGDTGALTYAVTEEYAHEVDYIDLFAAATGADLAFVWYLLREPLGKASAAIPARILFELVARFVFDHVDEDQDDEEDDSETDHDSSDDTEATDDDEEYSDDDENEDEDEEEIVGYQYDLDRSEYSADVDDEEDSDEDESDEDESDEDESDDEPDNADDVDDSADDESDEEEPDEDDDESGDGESDEDSEEAEDEADESDEDSGEGSDENDSGDDEAEDEADENAEPDEETPEDDTDGESGDEEAEEEKQDEKDDAGDENEAVSESEESGDSDEKPEPEKEEKPERPQKPQGKRPPEGQRKRDPNGRPQQGDGQRKRDPNGRPQPNDGQRKRDPNGRPQQGDGQHRREPDDRPQQSRYSGAVKEKRRMGLDESTRTQNSGVSSRYLLPAFTRENARQDESLFIKSERAESKTAVFDLPDGVKLPAYINDDEFLDQWLNEGDDMTSSEKRHKRRVSAAIGAVFTIFAFIGFILVMKYTMGVISNLGQDNGAEDAYQKLITPVVSSEVPVFETWDTIPKEKLLQSAIFNIISNSEENTYEVDDTNKIKVPQADVLRSARELYGSEVTFDAEMLSVIDSDDVYYSDTDDSYHIAMTGISGPQGQIIATKKNGDTIILTVGYLEETVAAESNDYYRQDLFVLSPNGDDADGHYVSAIREPEKD